MKNEGSDHNHLRIYKLISSFKYKRTYNCKIYSFCTIWKKDLDEAKLDEAKIRSTGFLSPIASFKEKIDDFKSKQNSAKQRTTENQIEEVFWDYIWTARCSNTFLFCFHFDFFLSFCMQNCEIWWACSWWLEKRKKQTITTQVKMLILNPLVCWHFYGQGDGHQQGSSQ